MSGPVRMHDDELDIDAALVRRLVAARFPQWAELPVHRVDSAGTDNAMFRLGPELAVRLPRLVRTADSLGTELRWLPRLAPLLPVAVPTPLASGEPTEDYPCTWSVLRWLPGANPTAGQVTAPVRLAEDLARFVTALRRADTADAPAAGRGVPLATRDQPTRAAIEALRGLGLVDVDAVTAAWEQALRVPARPGPAAWVHGDLGPGNVLVDRGRLTGVIDFGCAGVGDPTVDLIVAWNLLPAEARPVLRAALGADDATWARGRGWALSISLIQLPYYRHTNPVLAANSLHVIREVLADRQR